MQKKSKTPPSYLERLQFDPKLLLSPVSKYITNTRLVLLLVLTIVLMGSLAYSQLPKRLNPEVKIPIVTVATILPGAGSADVEQLVSIPLEDQLRGLKGLDTITSLSRDNISFVTLQFLSTVNRDKAKDDVQAAVDSVKDLPENAQSPKVTALDFEDQPIWIFALTSTKSYPDLMNVAKSLKARIDDLPKVDRVLTTGFDIQEVEIRVSPEKLTQLGINPFELSQAIKKARGSYPAGSVSTGSNSFSVTIDPSIEDLHDIANLQLQIQGKTVSLSDVATVAYISTPNQQQTYVAKPDGQPLRAVTFYVYKSADVNIDDAGESVKEVVHTLLQEQGDSYAVTTLINTSEEITKQFADLLKEFRSTIILVFITLFLFLGLRQAIISSFTVPLTFLSAFVFMQITGMTINFLSLFAFLLSLGLLIDDTIVAVSAMTSYFKSGKFTPTQTGLLVWKDTIVPIWSTTITTIWSFVPLLLSTGIIGEFIKPIPIVVTVTMISSTAIAVLVTLPIMMVLLKPVIPHRVVVLMQVVLFLVAMGIFVTLVKSNPLFPLLCIVYLALLFIGYRVFPTAKKWVTKQLKRNTTIQRARTLLSKYSNHGVIDVEPFAHGYKNLITRILTNAQARKKIIIAIVLYAIFSFALLPLGLVKNEFFPKSDANEFQIGLELPAGTTIEETAKEAFALLPQLQQIPQQEFLTMEIGKSAGQQSVLNDSSNQAVFSVRLKEKEKRSISSIEITENVRKALFGYTKGTISVIEESGGPPAGSDLQIKLLGSDLGTLDRYADQIADHLKGQPGVTNVKKSVAEGTSKLTFVPDFEKMVENGISQDTVGFALRLYASGFPLDSIAFDPTSTEKTSVTMRLQKGNASLEGLSQLTVFNNRGIAFPLLSLGHFQMRPNPTEIIRENGERTISVSAGVAKGYAITDKNKELETFADTLNLPPGYAWKTGGVNEENTKSVQSILRAMIVSAVLILITMVIQFGSFRQAIIVLIVIPLAVSSVFLIFALTGTPLSFPALIGVLSLFGIVVTNSMFIVDKINLNRKEGMSYTEAIADAGASRMEPIILTKLCTVFGLLPITIADPLWRGLGGAIISGLLIASTIMLLFIPVLYYVWMRPEEEKRPQAKKF